MWPALLIPLLYILTVLAPYGYNYFNLFLKSLKNPDGSPTWTTAEVNTIPILGGAVNVVFGGLPLNSQCVSTDCWQFGSGQSCLMCFRRGGRCSSFKASCGINVSIVY